MKLITWNVNGVRAAQKKGLVEFVEREAPDILCLQETKGRPEQCEPELSRTLHRQGFWASAVRRGYSGVATFVREGAKVEVADGSGIHEYDSEGRFLISEHENGLLIYNIYFPNGGSGPERHHFKQRFLRDLNAHLKPLVCAGRQVIVVGDYNVAHRDIDIYDPKGLAGESGFLREERQWIDSFLSLGFVDTFRYLHPKQKEIYTWWSARERARVDNRGWRIDYVCITENLLERLRRAEILDQQHGSDHCPVVVEMSF